MRRIVEFQIPDGGRVVLIRELKVRDIRDWLASKKGATDIVDASLFEKIPLDDLPRFTDLTMEDIDELAPSEIALIIEKIEEVNPDFFAMREKVVKLGSAILAIPPDSNLPLPA